MQINMKEVGPCAKQTTRTTLVNGEKLYVGENWCRNPQKICPRNHGEGYEKCKTICDQVGHSEEVAVMLAGENAKGATAYLEGHSYYCMNCQHVLFGAGVIALKLGKPPVVRG